MSNQIYNSYRPSSYGGGEMVTSLHGSRSVSDSYLSNDSLYRYWNDYSLSSVTALSTSMSYDPDNYSIRIPGVSVTTPTHSYGPPGVDLASAVASSDSLYAGLKRTSSYTKHTKCATTSHLPVYPQRPGEKDCAFYMQTRTCKFGDSCMFDHPIWVPEGGIPDWKEMPPLPTEALPERPGEMDCPYFLKTQRCKFGFRCRFNHPKDMMVPQVGETNATSVLPERPSEPSCAFYMKTGNCKFGMTCKFNHPKDVQVQSTGFKTGSGLQSSFEDAKLGQSLFSPAAFHNTKGLPLRLDREDCPFYLKTGSCKYGATCRYNHPERNVISSLAAALSPSLLTSAMTSFNIGVAPTAPLLSSFYPRLTQSTLGLGSSIYPQRPGQLECDYYLKTGACKYGDSCKYHHPLDRSLLKFTLAGLPRREGAIHCPYYMKTGSCKYGSSCKFDHPPPGEVMTATTEVTSAIEGSELGASL